MTRLPSPTRSSQTRALRFGVGGVGELERQHHVLERGQRGQELERLEYEAQQTLAQRRARILVECGKRIAVDIDLARGGLVEPRHQAQQRGLAGT